MTVIAVVTKVGEPIGNLALAFNLFFDQAMDGVTPPRPLSDALGFGVAMGVRQPVFNVGEILILDNGREPGWPGRCPGKWDIETTPCASIEEAATLAAQVMNAEPVG